jgi:hypothetical protein
MRRASIMIPAVLGLALVLPAGSTATLAEVGLIPATTPPTTPTPPSCPGSPCLAAPPATW